MKIEHISANLKENLQTFSRDTVSMCPNQTANFLLLCGEILLKYVEYSNRQLEPDSEALLSGSDVEKIRILFSTLGTSFFPMAHTAAPLRDLKIVNALQYEDLNNRVENLLTRFVHNYETSIETNFHNMKLLHERIGELQDLRREIRTVLNP
ncbi:MAG: hypothetical protein O2971_13200 [Proteobacteria bacterium]|nr:hypothetical protein [Pseudomonadota bacterium]